MFGPETDHHQGLVEIYMEITRLFTLFCNYSITHIILVRLYYLVPLSDSLTVKSFP